MLSCWFVSTSYNLPRVQVLFSTIGANILTAHASFDQLNRNLVPEIYTVRSQVSNLVLIVFEVFRREAVINL